MTQRVPRTRRVDIVVHGRFFAFDLAAALKRRGTDVHVVTNYPRWVLPRFGLDPRAATTYPAHGIAVRLRDRLGRLGRSAWLEAALHRAFGAWAARRLRPDLDAVIAFSGVAEESFARNRGAALRILVRASSHIRAQYEILHEEEMRAGERIDKPTEWMISREEREYRIADRIVVLSKFALRTFAERGASVERVKSIGLASDPRKFLAGEASIRDRCTRIGEGRPLRVLMVGSFTFRKGALDFVTAARELGAKATFRFVGDPPSARSALGRLSKGVVQIRPRVPEAALADEYKWADIFCLPTLEDGYAVVIAQALSAGLPVITTTNSSGPEIVRENVSGWIVPVRDAGAIVERLRWCDSNRDALMTMAHRARESQASRTWDDVAREFEELIDA